MKERCFQKKIHLIPVLISILLLSTHVKAKEVLQFHTLKGILYATSVKTASNNPYDLRASMGSLDEEYPYLQAGCSDGLYAYFTLWNKKLDQCKIAKFLLREGKAPVFQKVSGPLPIDHGNDLTYNPDTGKLIVVHCMKNYIGNKKIDAIDTNSLEISSRIAISIPDRVLGADGNYVGDEIQEKLESETIGFDGITYNKSKDQYAVLIKESSDFIILDHSFRVVRYLKTKVRNDYINQGIDCTDGHILMSQSRKTPGTGNILSVYNWDDGTYLKKISILGIRNDYEIENIFHVNDVYYTGVYAYDKDYKQLRFCYLYTLGTAPNVYGIHLNRESLTLRTGKGYQLTAAITPVSATNKTVRWSSDNPSVASVGSNGWIKALRPGKVCIRARTVEGLYVTSCSVTVLKPKLYAPAKLRWKAGKSRSLKIYWTRKGSSDGCQLQISRSKKFSKAKTKSLNIKRKTQAKIKKLKRGKWYVRVRSFAKYSGKKYYSEWSAVKRIRLK